MGFWSSFHILASGEQMSYYIVCKEISSIRKECGSCRAIAEDAVACKRTERRKRLKTEKQMLIIISSIPHKTY